MTSIITIHPKNNLRRSIWLVFMLAASGLVYGTETADAGASDGSVWNPKMAGHLNLSNAYYDNWAQGGENAFQWEVGFDGSLERNFSQFEWKSAAKLEYGQLKQGSAGFRKSLDEFFVETVLNYKWLKMIKPYTSATIQSQFTNGYNYSDTSRNEVSGFWDPGYITQSAGLEYAPAELFLTRLGFSMKETFSSDHGYADDAETTTETETFKWQPGLESVSELKYSFNDKMKLESKLKIFADFEEFESIDGKWENGITAKLASYVNINLGFDVLYDKDISESRQIKQNVSLGLNYTFF